MRHYAIPRVTALLARELAARGVAEAALVGHSAGAYRAFALALSGQVTVTHIVSVAGVAGYDADVRAAFRDFARIVREDGDLRPLWLPRMAGPDFAETFPEDAADVMAWLDAAPRSVLAAELDAFADAEDLRPRLHELTIPITARVGESDRATPVALSRSIVENATHATLQIVAGCGHALFYDDREATVEAIAAALEG